MSTLLRWCFSQISCASLYFTRKFKLKKKKFKQPALCSLTLFFWFLKNTAKKKKNEKKKREKNSTVLNIILGGKKLNTFLRLDLCHSSCKDFSQYLLIYHLWTSVEASVGVGAGPRADRHTWEGAPCQKDLSRGFLCASVELRSLKTSKEPPVTATGKWETL